MDPDRTRSDPDRSFFSDLDLILLITFKLIVDVCQNIHLNVQSVVAYWRI